MTAARIERTYRLILLASLVATFLLIAVGAIVRVSGSGLGCTSWPDCQDGNVIPVPRVDAWIEFSHRLAASVVSVLVLASLAGAWRFYRRHPVVWRLALVVSGLLLFQIVLGGITVKLELPEDIVTLHLGTALAIFATLIVLSMVFVRPRGSGVRDLTAGEPGVSRFFWLTAATAGAIYAVLLSGAYVRGHGAASACGNEWPLCLGSVLPQSEMTAVHLGHRYLVLLVSLLVLIAVVQAWRLRSGVPALGHAAATLAAGFVLQVLVGAAVPMTKLAPVAQAAHLAVATLVWGSAIALASLAWWVTPTTGETVSRPAADSAVRTTTQRAWPDTPGTS